MKKTLIVLLVAGSSLAFGQSRFDSLGSRSRRRCYAGHNLNLQASFDRDDWLVNKLVWIRDEARD